MATPYLMGHVLHLVIETAVAMKCCIRKLVVSSSLFSREMLKKCLSISINELRSVQSYRMFSYTLALHFVLLMIEQLGDLHSSFLATQG